MNPSTLYYLLLYLLVLVVNFFRVRKRYQLPDENTPNPEKFNWRPILYISLDIVYTSAGFIILLMQNLREWVPVLVICYFIIVLFSANLDSISEKFGANFKLFAHLSIVIIIIIITIITFNTEIIFSNVSKYQVAIPYTDKSLILNLGYDKIGEKEFVYIINVNAINKNEAINKALEEFETVDLSDLVINPDTLRNKVIVIQKDKITVENK